MDDRAKAVEISRTEGVVNAVRFHGPGQSHAAVLVVDLNGDMNEHYFSSAAAVRESGIDVGSRVVYRTTLEVVRPQPASPLVKVVWDMIPASVAAKMEAGKTYFADPTSGTVYDKDYRRVEPDPPAPPEPEASPIPSFPPIATDKQGRIIPMSQEEREARGSALVRALDAASRPGREDPAPPEPEGRKIKFRQWT